MVDNSMNVVTRESWIEVKPIGTPSQMLFSVHRCGQKDFHASSAVVDAEGKRVTPWLSYVRDAQDGTIYGYRSYDEKGDMRKRKEVAFKFDQAGELVEKRNLVSESGYRWVYDNTKRSKHGLKEKKPYSKLGLVEAQTTLSRLSLAYPVIHKSGGLLTASNGLGSRVLDSSGKTRSGYFDRVIQDKKGPVAIRHGVDRYDEPRNGVYLLGPNGEILEKGEFHRVSETKHEFRGYKNGREMPRTGIERLDEVFPEGVLGLERFGNLYILRQIDGGIRIVDLRRQANHGLYRYFTVRDEDGKTTMDMYGLKLKMPEEAKTERKKGEPVLSASTLGYPASGGFGHPGYEYRQDEFRPDGRMESYFRPTVRVERSGGKGSGGRGK